MSYLTRDQLKAFGSGTLTESRKKVFKSATASAAARVFLSHSHKDRDSLEPALEMLRHEGVDVYVDWKDETMPDITGPETAKALKDRIKKQRKFILLATDNALASRWVPWELAIADCQNGMKNVAILPVTDPPRSWPGSEYVGIYDCIEWSNTGKLMVVEAGTRKGPPLSEWLRR